MKRAVSILLLTTPLIGCLHGPRSPAVPRPHVSATIPVQNHSASYSIGCPDVLNLRFPAASARDCLAAVDLDGRLNLGQNQRPHVEGLSLEQAREVIARETGQEVQVQLTESRSSRIYVRGPELSRQRVVEYRGPQPVLEFLERAGCILPGQTNFREVSVIRPNIAIGGKPEIYPVDFSAIVRGDLSTNVLLRPSDEVIVGETRRSSFARLLPSWCVPIYQRGTAMMPMPELR